MNDFTKEELEWMLDKLEWMVSDFSEPDSTYEFKDKIQSLIDNYRRPVTKKHPMYKCIRCESKEVEELFAIKYGLHNWFLCVECSRQFIDWVGDKKYDNGCGWSKEYFKRKYGDK